MSKSLGPVHNSHLGAIRRCTKKFDYAYNQNLQKKLPSLPLVRGIWVHSMLQAMALAKGIDEGTLLVTPKTIFIEGVGECDVVIDGDKPKFYVEGEDDLFDAFPLTPAGMLDCLTTYVWDSLFDLEKEKYSENGYDLPTQCRRMVEEYMVHWKEDWANTEFLLVEYDWKREYKDGIEFEGRGDYVRRDKTRDLIILGDWKTTGRMPGPEFKFMESQLNLYPWGAEPMLAEHGIKIDAVEFEYISSKLPTVPSQNQDGRLSKRKIETTELTFRRALKEYGLKFTPAMKELLEKCQGEFFVRKTFPRNQKVVATLLEENYQDALRAERVLNGEELPTRSVRYTCSFDCDFLSLCRAELYGEDARVIRKREYESRTDSRGAVSKHD